MVVALRRDHDQLRDSLRHITVRLERLTPDQSREFDLICQELIEITARLGDHNNKEMGLLQDSFVLDVGGEGGGG